MHRHQHFSLTVFLCLLAIGTAAHTQVAPVSWGFRLGDDLAWADDSVDGVGWQEELPRTGPRWWALLTFDFEKDIAPSDHLEVRIYALGASEVYWDGELIGRNGRLGGQHLAEVPGRHRISLAIPHGSRAKGAHRLALRLSSERAVTRPRFFRASLGDFRAEDQRRDLHTAIAATLVGALIVVGVFFVVWSRSVSRDSTTTLLGSLSLVVALLIVSESLRDVWAYPYPMHLVRLVAISVLTWVVAVLLPAFLWRRLDLPGARLGLGIMAAVGLSTFMAAPDFDVHCLWLMRGSLAVSVILASWGLLRRSPGSGWVALGVSLCALPAPLTGFRLADRYFFWAYAAMASVFMVEALLRIRANERRRRSAEVQTAQLRYELLRTSIQPHFLMNVLAVAEAWFEEEPRRGREVLRALAKQLESFFAISEREFVPVEEELELCQRTLEIMSHLLETDARLVTKGVPDGVAIPPGLFLTLVENALRHGDTALDPFVIALDAVEDREGWTFSMRNPVRDDPPEEGTGRGLSFIRDLLTGHTGDSQGGLTVRRVGREWLAVVRLPHAFLEGANQLLVSRSSHRQSARLEDRSVATGTKNL